MTERKNLGEIRRPILVFGGPYSNLQATEALLREARSRGISADHIFCTGDVVAYAGDPAATTDAVMASNMHVVMGNCEESFGSERDDCGCGFDQGSACDLLSRQWYAHANRELRPDQRAWMRALPRQIRFELSGRRFTLIHGGVDNISRWIFKSTDHAVKRQEIARIETSGVTDVVIGGHCGLPFADDLGDRLWLNAGVIGMPANDATNRTWFMVIEPGSDGPRIELHPLVYDHQAAAARMRSLQLAGAYAETLVSGLWPNMDVLPEAERGQVGQALVPWSIGKPMALPMAAP